MSAGDGAGFDWLDLTRSASLGDVGLPDYLAAATVNSNGDTGLVLVRRDRIDDPAATYSAACAQAPHEQLGPLPLEFVRRLTASRGRQRTEGGDQ